MSMEGLLAVNEHWKESMIIDYENEAFLRYEPFSDKYWSSKVKVVLCNLEQYGYEDQKGEVKLDLTLFSYEYRKRYRTIYYSGLFMYALEKVFNKNEEVTIDDLENVKKNDEMVIDSISNILYMNITKLPNATINTSEDTIGIHKYIDPKFYDEVNNRNKHNTERFIEYLNETNASIIFVSGETGADIFNKIYGPNFHLGFNSSAILKNKLLVSMYHPGNPRFTFEYMTNKINETKYKYDKLVL